MVGETVSIVIGLIGLLGGAALVVVALLKWSHHHDENKD